MNTFGQYLYNCLPSIYRIKDQDVGYTLQRYLDVLGKSLDDVNIETMELLTLIDVEKMDARFLPFYASMFGLTYDYDVPEDFQRRLLANIVDIYKRKGTKAVIEFVARELTGMEATVMEGHKSIFKTWTDTPNTDNVSGYIVPKTYGGMGKRNFYIYSDDVNGSTSRFIITVSLSSKDLDTQDLFLNTQLISRYTAKLVQPYIQLIYKAFGLQYSDERVVSNITEESSIKVLDTDIKSTKITEVDVYSRVLQKDNLTYDNNLIGQPLDKLKLLRMEIDGNTNDITEVGQDTMKIVTRLSDIINLSLDKEWSDNIRDIQGNENIEVTITVKKDTHILKDADLTELNSSVDYLIDCVHPLEIDAIINIGDIESEYTDNITQIE